MNHSKITEFFTKYFFFRLLFMKLQKKWVTGKMWNLDTGYDTNSDY